MNKIKLFLLITLFIAFGSTIFPVRPTQANAYIWGNIQTSAQFTALGGGKCVYYLGSGCKDGWYASNKSNCSWEPCCKYLMTGYEVGQEEFMFKKDCNGGTTTSGTESIEPDKTKCSKNLDCCCNTPPPTEQTTAPVTPKFKMPDFVFQVPIPGLTKLSTIDCSSGSCQISWISEYIFAIYNYGLLVAGVIAVLILMAAGILWIVSGGDSAKITKAKQLITGSITGLFLMLAMNIFLVYINPNIIKQKSLSLDYIKEVTVVNKYEIQGCTGQWANNKITGKKLDATVIDAIKKVSAERKINPCYYYAIISQESQGVINALADDRAVANCDIGARKKYICAQFAACCGVECTNADCRKKVEDKTIMPTKPNPNDISTFDLSGATTYGLGLGQITYQKQYGLCNNNKGFYYPGSGDLKKCYNFSDLLTKPEVNLQAMTDGTLSYYCKQAASNGTPTLDCFSKYAGTGAWAQCTGGKKMTVYQKCMTEGFANIANKNWSATTAN